MQVLKIKESLEGCLVFSIFFPEEMPSFPCWRFWVSSSWNGKKIEKGLGCCFFWGLIWSWVQVCSSCKKERRWCLSLCKLPEIPTSVSDHKRTKFQQKRRRGGGGGGGGGDLFLKRKRRKKMKEKKQRFVFHQISIS